MQKSLTFIFQQQGQGKKEGAAREYVFDVHPSQTDKRLKVCAAEAIFCWPTENSHHLKS
jgi:hypothetical protein